MSLFRPIEVRGRRLGDGWVPAICIPLIARTAAALEAELAAALRESPDIVEWRADHFLAGNPTEPNPAAAVMAIAQRLRSLAKDIPLIFTLRSAREGGETLSIDALAATALIESMAGSQQFEFVDIELALEESRVLQIIEAAHGVGAQVILSSHDFSGTPSTYDIFERLRRCATLGADVAKVAVMPQSADDVLALLAATSRAQREIALPVITMAMGPLGVLTRVFGGVFGSALSFASGLAASAPGQLPAQELRAAFQLVRSRSLPR